MKLVRGRYCIMCISHYRADLWDVGNRYFTSSVCVTHRRYASTSDDPASDKDDILYQPCIWSPITQVCEDFEDDNY
jgi:hypothetical protein